MDHCQASDSPGELLRITIIEGCRYGSLLPVSVCYDDDDDGDGDVCTVKLIFLHFSLQVVK